MYNVEEKREEEGVLKRRTIIPAGLSAWYTGVFHWNKHIHPSGHCVSDKFTFSALFPLCSLSLFQKMKPNICHKAVHHSSIVKLKATHLMQRKLLYQK